jgi:3',5'-cyclic AMP phosphodiesterase CpdA
MAARNGNKHERLPEVSLLHLTDLHFGYLGKDDEALLADEDKENVDPRFREKVIDQFLHILREGDRFLKSDVIAVTGDLTIRAKPDGYKILREQALDPLRRLLKSRQESLCIVPGNHDVTWDLDPNQAHYFDQKFRKFRNFTDEAGATTCLFPKDRSDPNQQAIEFEERENSPLYIDHDKKIFVLCLNSAMRCGERNVTRRKELLDLIDPIANTLAEVLNAPGAEQLPIKIRGDVKSATETFLKDLHQRVEAQTVFDIAHVTSDQIQVLSNKLTELHSKFAKEWDSYIRIAILHHHLLPFDRQVSEYKPFELMSDSSLVLRLLGQFRFHLVLTGHKHKPYVTRHFHTEAHEFGSRQMLLLGGATVAGNPSRSSRQAFRHIRMQRRETELEVAITDLPIDFFAKPEEYFKPCFDASKSYSVPFGMYSSNYCQFGTAREPINIHTSDQLINVNTAIFLAGVNASQDSCQKVWNVVKQLLKDKTPMSVGLYVLYGFYDLLVLLQDPNLDDSVLDKLANDLDGRINPVRTIFFRKGSCFDQVNPSEPEANLRIRPPLYRGQNTYDAHRWFKIFIMFNKTKGDHLQTREINLMNEAVANFWATYKMKLDAANWRAYWGNDQYFVQGLLQCGQQKELNELTKMLEQRADGLGLSKLTCIAYVHEEGPGDQVLSTRYGPSAQWPALA